MQQQLAYTHQQLASLLLQHGVRLLSSSPFYESASSKFYDCTFNSAANMILKIQVAELPPVKQLNKYHKEYETALLFKHHSNIVTVESLLNLGTKNATVMQKHGTNLAAFLKKARRLRLETVVDIAVQLVDAIGALHEKEIIHGSICPSHILIQEEETLSTAIPSQSTSSPQHQVPPVKSYHVKLCDLGFSTDLRKDHAKPITSSKYPLNLMYVSPEQTGRMNREIDYRTDYSKNGTSGVFFKKGDAR